MTSTISRKCTIVALALTVTIMVASLAPIGMIGSANADSVPQLRPRHAPSFPATAERTDVLAELASAAYRSLAWSTSWGRDVSSLQYDDLRHQVAMEVAARLDVPGDFLSELWADLDVERQRALLAGLSQVGVPYRSMKSLPGEGFDCSGLTSYAWRLGGIELPRSSGDQMRAAARIDADSAQAGDLVYFPGHVMMSLGFPGAVLHSPQSGRVVEVEVFSGRRTLQYADPLA